jgi:REP element-mobilizing transposase RayT
MAPTPLYPPSELESPAFHLRYSWCGWFRSPVELSESIWPELDAAWEADGLRRLETIAGGDQVQLTMSALPHVSPVFLAQRIKGRLKHSLGSQATFSRKLSVRALGDNRSQHVADYIARQVKRAEFADSRFADELAALTEVTRLDLTQPTESRSGRYWYNLHLVLVGDGRLPSHDLASLRTIFDGCAKIAAKKGYLLAARSVMPDHLHLAIRVPPDQSPESVALAYLNNLAFLLGQRRWWMPSYYVGTFGEYDMHAVRKGR